MRYPGPSAGIIVAHRCPKIDESSQNSKEFDRKILVAASEGVSQVVLAGGHYSPSRGISAVSPGFIPLESAKTSVPR